MLNASAAQIGEVAASMRSLEVRAALVSASDVPLCQQCSAYVYFAVAVGLCTFVAALSQCRLHQLPCQLQQQSTPPHLT